MSESLGEFELQLDADKAIAAVESLKERLDALKSAKAPKDEISKLATELEKAQKKAKDLASQLDEMAKRGASGRASLVQAIGGEELNEKLGKISNALKSAGDRSLGFTERVAGLVGGAGLAFNAISTLTNGLRDYAEEALANARASSLLVDGYQGIAAATGNAVSAQQALSDQQALLAQGVELSAGRLASLEQAGVGYSQVFGGTASQAIATFTQAVERGDNTVLSRFGVHLDQTTAQADRMSTAVAALQQQLSHLQPPPSSGGVWDWFQNLGNLSQHHTETDLQQQQREYREQLVGLQHELMRVTEQERLHGEMMRATGRQTQGAAFDLKDYTGQLQQTVAQQEQVERQYRDGEISQEEYRQQVENIRHAENELTYVNQALADSVRDVAKAQNELTLEMLAGETKVTHLERLMRAAKERIDMVRRERADRADISHRLTALFGAQGATDAGFGAHGGGGNGALQALRQAKLEYADVVRQLDDAGVVFEQRARKNHESMTAYFHSLHTEAQAALAAQHKQNDLLAAQHDLEKQLQLDAERKQRDLVDANRELEKRGSLIRQQFADMTRSIGDTSTNASVQRAAEESLGLRGFVPGGEDRSQQRSVLMGRIASLGAEAAANPQDEVMQMQLQQQAQAIQQTIQQYDQLRTAQMDALDWSRQFTLAFQSHAELTNTAAQNLAQSASGAYSTLTSAVTTHFAALINGQEDAATAGRLFVNQIATQVASQSLPLALFETAQAIGAAASYRFVEAGQHAAAAGIYFGLTAGGAGLAAATSPASAKSTASAGGFNEPARSTPASSERDSGGRTVVFNYYGGMSIDTKDDIARNMIHLLDHGAALGHVPRATLREGR